MTVWKYSVEFICSPRKEEKERKEKKTPKETEEWETYWARDDAEIVICVKNDKSKIEYIILVL